MLSTLMMLGFLPAFFGNDSDRSDTEDEDILPEQPSEEAGNLLDSPEFNAALAEDLGDYHVGDLRLVDGGLPGVIGAGGESGSVAIDGFDPDVAHLMVEIPEGAELIVDRSENGVALWQSGDEAPLADFWGRESFPADGVTFRVLAEDGGEELVPFDALGAPDEAADLKPSDPDEPSRPDLTPVDGPVIGPSDPDEPSTPTLIPGDGPVIDPSDPDVPSVLDTQLVAVSCGFVGEEPIPLDDFIAGEDKLEIAVEPEVLEGDPDLDIYEDDEGTEIRLNGEPLVILKGTVGIGLDDIILRGHAA